MKLVLLLVLPEIETLLLTAALRDQIPVLLPVLRKVALQAALLLADLPVDLPPATLLHHLPIEDSD